MTEDVGVADRAVDRHEERHGVRRPVLARRRDLRIDGRARSAGGGMAVAAATAVHVEARAEAAPGVGHRPLHRVDLLDRRLAGEEELLVEGAQARQRATRGGRSRANAGIARHEVGVEATDAPEQQEGAGEERERQPETARAHRFTYTAPARRVNAGGGNAAPRRAGVHRRARRTAVGGQRYTARNAALKRRMLANPAPKAIADIGIAV